MSKKRKELEWGETPWDDMSREDLLREVQAAYAALSSARSAMHLSKGPEPGRFWGAEGSGGRALAMAEIFLRRVEDRFESENIYRSFFRYAVDLLFTPELGHGWNICESGHMTGRVDRTPIATCSQCQKPMRRIEWRDLAKVAK